MFEKKLPREFYDRPADLVAPDLLGKIFCVRHKDSIIKCKILETEAYLGREDKACHAHKGLTPRTSVMFGPPGFSYIYLIYGIHHMMNVVTHREGEPHAVLIRKAQAIFPLKLKLHGPGVLTKSLKITKRHNALDLCGSEIYFLEAPDERHFIKSPRIGVDYAKEWASKPLRYTIPHD